MQINISGLHLEVTDALRSYVEEKFERLSRHFDRIISIQVILQVEKLKQKAEVPVHVRGKDIFVESDDADLYAAVDSMADKLDRQMQKHKQKQSDHNHEAIKHQSAAEE